MHDDSNTRNRYRLPNSSRIRLSSDYSAVFQRHQKASNQLFRILVRYNRSRRAARLGVIVSRRVSRKAVERNRIKRQIREIFRLKRKNLTAADFVVIAYRPCEAASNPELRMNLTELFQKLEKCEKS